MAEYRLPTAEGRELLIRTCTAGPRPMLQVAIVSTYGNLIEAATIEAGDALGLARGAGKVARYAAARFDEARIAARIEADERWKAALAGNPWQTLGPEDRKRRGLV